MQLIASCLSFERICYLQQVIDPIKLQKQRHFWKKNVDMQHKDERKKLQSIGFREKMLGWLMLQELTIQIMLYLVAVTHIVLKEIS